MITAKEAKEKMADAHIQYKKTLLDLVSKDVDRAVQSSIERFKTVATVKVSPLIRNEAVELLKKNGYDVISNGPDELTIDWSAV